MSDQGGELAPLTRQCPLTAESGNRMPYAESGAQLDLLLVRFLVQLLKTMQQVYKIQPLSSYVLPMTTKWAIENVYMIYLLVGIEARAVVGKRENPRIDFVAPSGVAAPPLLFQHLFFQYRYIFSIVLFLAFPENVLDGTPFPP